MKIGIRILTDDGLTFIGSIIPSGNRLITEPVDGMEDSATTLSGILDTPILTKQGRISSKDNPKLFLQRLPDTYNGSYVQATLSKNTIKKDLVEKTITPISPEEIEIAIAQSTQWVEEQSPIIVDGIDTTGISDLLGVEKSVVKDIGINESFILTFDDIPAIQLPEGFEEQLPIIPEGVDMIEVSPELEKAFFDLFGHVLLAIRGFLGRWITLKGGRRIFIKIKNVFSSDVTTKEARAASLAFKKLPIGVRKNINRFEVRSRNIVEKVLPAKLTPRLLTKKLYRISQHSLDQKSVVIRPGRLRVMQSLKQTPTTLVRGRRVKKPILDIGDLVNLNGGRALYPSLSGVTVRRGRSSLQGPVAMKELTQRFGTATNQDKGVTRLAEKIRLQLSSKNFGASLSEQKLDALTHIQGQENFAELYMIYRRRNSKFRLQWARLQKTHQATLVTFLNIVEALGG